MLGRLNHLPRMHTIHASRLALAQALGILRRLVRLGMKAISWGEVHRSVEKGNFEGERARRIAFPSETYTYRG